ncbi:MAG: hypothetical protein WD872_11345 [Pirellulaceae bacterium]
MSVNPLRFVGGLAIELGVLVLIVTLLPRMQSGPHARAEQGEVADERPSLLTPPRAAPLPEPDWRTAAHRQELPQGLPPPDPAYVEQRLDQVGQQLLSGVSSYLSHAAQDFLEPPAAERPFIALNAEMSRVSPVLSSGARR